MLCLLLRHLYLYTAQIALQERSCGKDCRWLPVPSCSTFKISCSISAEATLLLVFSNPMPDHYERTEAWTFLLNVGLLSDHFLHWSSPLCGWDYLRAHHSLCHYLHNLSSPPLHLLVSYLHHGLKAFPHSFTCHRFYSQQISYTFDSVLVSVS